MGFKSMMTAINKSKDLMLKKMTNFTNLEKIDSLNKTLHVSTLQKYPAAAVLPLPVNVDAAESTRFSPQRSRDISATAILSHQSTLSKFSIDITLDSSMASMTIPENSSLQDPHVESYDCFGAVSLNSSMQSNVPSPFGGLHKFTHLNMPGGQWSQDSKFMSENLHNSHYTNLRRETRATWNSYNEDIPKKGMNDDGTTINNLMTASLFGLHNNNYVNKHFLHRSLFAFYNNKNNINNNIRLFSSSQNQQTEIKEQNNENLTKKEKLKKAIKEYGATVIVFHVGISLVSLGMFYLLVSSGIDIPKILENIGFASTALSNKVTTGAGTFIIAYTVHKFFAPVRISITLGATPFIVKYMRQKGFLKR